MAQVKKEIAAVYNANHSKAWEEEITDIHHDSSGNVVGVVEQSFGRSGKAMNVVQNLYHKTWQYNGERRSC
jgi:hypothetical protein